MHDFVWRGVYWWLGWSRIPRDLQARIDSLLDDLPDSLNEHVLVIPRLASWRLYSLLPPLLAAGGWLVALHEGLNETGWIAGGVLFGFVFTWAMIRAYPLMLILSRDGARFILRNGEILCPWSLLAAQGEPDDYGMYLLLPTNADSMQDVELRKQGQVVATGGEVQSDSFQFIGDSQLKLVNTLQLGPSTLGMLLQELAFAMTAESARIASDPTSLDSPEWSREPNGVVVEEGRRITLPVARLQFPPECCCCGDATEATRRIEAVWRLFGIGSKMSLYLEIPCCRACRRGESLRMWLGTILSLAVVIGVAGCIALAIVGPPAQQWEPFLLLTALVTVFGLIPALDFGRSCLLKTRASYLRRSECVRLSFRQPGYAKRVSEFHRRTGTEVK